MTNRKTTINKFYCARCPLVFLIVLGTLFFFARPGKASADITTSLVGHWKFDEISGVLAPDASGNGNNGDLINGPSWTTGEVNGGLSFSGGTDYVDLGQKASLHGMSNLTISAWANPTVLKDQYIIVWLAGSGLWYRDNYYLGITADGSLMGMVGFPNGSSPRTLSCTFGGAGTVTTGSWQHFTMKWDGTTLTGYKNGSALGTTCTGTGAISNLSNQSAKIGSSFQGSLDEVRIYSRSLSTSDITELYNFTEEVDITPPTVTAFTIPETSTSLTVPISTFTATDDSGIVTGYLLTESATTPDADDPDWSGTAQTEYSFSGEGAKTLYAWAKDAAGHISNSENDTVTVALPVLNNYWVSPTGTASWTYCHSDTPLDGTSACSLATANSNLTAGDTAYLREGTYDTHIFPAHSGTDASHRITYSAYNGEIPVIKNTTTPYSTYYHGIALLSRSYIKIDGITVGPEATMDRVLMITAAGSYNEIVDCVIDGAEGSNIQIWDGDSLDSGPQPSCVHNWIHDSIIRNTGSVSEDCNDNGGVQLGVPGHDSDSNFNTIEDNTFYCGGHHNLETFTKYNIIRNNYFHNEGCMTPPGSSCTYGPDTNDLYGNRNIQIYDGYGEDKYNLLEGNRFGHAGPPPDDDGGDGMTITAPKNIIRYNSIFNSLNNGVLFKSGASSYADNNRFYNNTIYKSGRYHNTGPQWQGYNFRWYGSYARTGNVIKNNILNTYGLGAGDWTGGDANIYINNTVTNNFCTDASAGRCSAYGDPLFNDTDVSDPASPTHPDLRLQGSSSAIDAGTYLTQANGSGNSSITLIVDDALYFQDGTWGSSLDETEADWIAIGTVSNAVQISSIDYDTNTITLASSMTWSDNDSIWLYKDSSGAQILYGSASDCGAYEFVGTGDTTPPTVTTFAVPETATTLTVSITTFTATDDSGTVTGYLLTESADTPDVDDPDWSGTAQTDYTFSSEGAKTLYAWAKDAAGNVSISLNDSVTITLPTYTIGGTISGLTGTAVLQNNGGDDLTVTANGSFSFATALYDGDTYSVIVSDQPDEQTCTVTNGTGTVSGANVTNISVTCEDGADSTPPTVAAFSIPLTSDSLTIAITEFTATDDTAVTGYLLTELSSAPSPSDAGWEVAAPTEYTFSSEGAKTLYAWAKDGSGNVSESLNASIAVVLNAQVAGVSTKRKDDHKRDLDVHSVKFSSTATTFTVTWKTDYKANSKVKYGFTKEPKIKKKSSKRKKSHSITIKNLLPDRVYYFKASSTDQYGNEDKSKVYMVRTAKLWQWQR